MKKVSLLLLLLLLISAYAGAQNQYQEVVYLKDGSTVRGMIIEQVPNVSLKIKTPDGSIFAYPMTEVEKITKEPFRMRQRDASRRYSGNREYRYRGVSDENTLYNWAHLNQNLRGYKGFVDAGYQFDLSGHNANSFEVLTSHGYQFNNYIFVGGGGGIIYYTGLDKVMIPFFSNFRVNFGQRPATPFADVKLGYSAGDMPGAYFSLGLGMRIRVADRKAINLRLEYAAQQQGYEWEFHTNNGYDFYDASFTASSLGFKVGFEF